MSWWTKYTEVQVELAIANALAGGGPGTPSAPDTSVQFNNGGAFGGSADLTWDGAALTTLGRIVVTPAISLDAPPISLTYTDGIAGHYCNSVFESVGTFTNNGAGQSIYGQITDGNGAGEGGHFYGVRSFFIGNDVTAAAETYGFAGAMSFGAGGADVAYGLSASVFNLNGGTIATNYGVYVATPLVSGIGSAIAANFAFYAKAQGDTAITNSYSFWSDEQGVFRIRADNTFDSVYQAIASLYNPKFTKYTPGATDHERFILCQWNNNVAEIGTEKGGSGTLRKVRLIGGGLLLDSTILPTSNPGAGQLWNDGNTVKVGT